MKRHFSSSELTTETIPPFEQQQNNNNNNNSNKRRLVKRVSDAAEALIDLNYNLPLHTTTTATTAPEPSTAGGIDPSLHIIKGAWSSEEDRLMLEAVALYHQDWRAVSRYVKGRSAKQCRDRYRLKLDPAINHGPWTPEEDELLVELQSELGRQWTKIAKLIPGRTENAVKSRFSSLVRSKTKEWSEEEEEVIRRLVADGLPFAEISDKHLPHRSEHAVKKRWEKLKLRDIATEIKNSINPESSSSGISAAADLPSSAVQEQQQHSVPAEVQKEREREREEEALLVESCVASGLVKDGDLALAKAKVKLNPLLAASTVGSVRRKSLVRPELFAGPETTNVTHSSNQQSGLFYASGTHSGFTSSSSLSDLINSSAAVHKKHVNFEELSINQHQPHGGASEGEAARMSRARRFKRHSTSTTVMMQLIGEPLPQ